MWVFFFYYFLILFCRSVVSHFTLSTETMHSLPIGLAYFHLQTGHSGLLYLCGGNMYSNCEHLQDSPKQHCLGLRLKLESA